MSTEFDETLRTLQKLIKSQKDGAAKKSTLKRQTYRQIIQLKCHLREAMKLSKTRKGLSKDEQKELPALPLDTLQIHCMHTTYTQLIRYINTTYTLNIHYTYI